MKKISVLLYILLLVCNIQTGCKKQVDHFYTNTVFYTNGTEHDIDIACNTFSPAEPSPTLLLSLKPNETKSFLIPDGGDAPGLRFLRMTVTFDGEFSREYDEQDPTPGTNLLSVRSYRQETSKNGLDFRYYYTFTEEDYEDAAGKSAE